MKNTWNNLERIESWKYGEMDPEQKAKFELEMKQDSSLAEDLKTYENIIQHIEKFGNERTRRALMNVESKLDKEGFFDNYNGIVKPHSFKTNAKKMWAVAASLMLVVVASWLYISQYEGNSDNYYGPIAQNAKKISSIVSESHVIIADKINTDLDFLGDRGLGDKTRSKKDSLISALSMYKQDEYSKARIMLLGFLSVYPNDNTAQLYLGLSFLQEGEYGRAAKYLTPLTSVADTEEDRNIAKWYSALCYTQFGSESDLNTAIALLKDLADDPASHYERYAKAYLELLSTKK